MAGTQPAPTQEVVVVAEGLYGPTTKSWPSRSIPDNIQRIQVAVDMANRPLAAEVFLKIEWSLDGGTSWPDADGTITAERDGKCGWARAGIKPGEQHLAEMSVGVQGLPVQAGKFIRGEAGIINEGFTTSLTARVWT